MRAAFWGVVLSAGLFATAASANPIQTITFGGTAVSDSYDGLKLFNPQQYGKLTGDSFSVTISYDTAHLTDDCGTSTTSTSCEFDFKSATNAQESVTVNGITKSYTGSTGYVKFTANGTTDTIALSLNGTIVEMTATLPDGTSLFSSQSNVNNPLLLNNINSAAITGASFSTNITGNGGNTYVDAGSKANLTLTTSNLPEPASLAVFAAGLLGLGAVRLRHPSRTAQPGERAREGRQAI